MCSIPAIALLGVGAAANYKGQSEANDAAEAAVASSAAQQSILQQRQQSMLDQQDQRQAAARDIFQSTIMPSISKENVAQNEATQSDRLRQIFSSAATGQAGADPTQPASSVSTVGAPVSNSGAGGAAYDAALANRLAEAIGFTTQQAGARANMDGRTYAAADQQRQIVRGGEGIAQQNDAIHGLGRNIVGVGNLMDATTQAGQAAVNAASHKGDGWKTVGTVSNLAASMFGGGWGRLAGMVGMGAGMLGQGKTPMLNGAGAGAAAQRYYSPSGQRIN